MFSFEALALVLCLFKLLPEVVCVHILVLKLALKQLNRSLVVVREASPHLSSHLLDCLALVLYDFEVVSILLLEILMILVA